MTPWKTLARAVRQLLKINIFIYYLLHLPVPCSKVLFHHLEQQQLAFVTNIVSGVPIGTPQM